MSIVIIFSLAALTTPPPFEYLPGDASGRNCPDPPKTISTIDGRIYECHVEEGMDPYVDVTPPDEQTHWKLPFGSSDPKPAGTGTYHPPQQWPFRAILTLEGEASPRGQVFYEFDRNGFIINSNDSTAIGDQMMEVRISGIRMWPTAHVFYRLIPPGKGSERDRISNLDRLGDSSNYAYVVEATMLCPALDESELSSWQDYSASSPAKGKYINGHCGQSIGGDATYMINGVTTPVYYRYPGFESTGNGRSWALMLHGEPERPMLDQRGICFGFCKEKQEHPGN